jgi:hypothetical protein
MFCEMGYQQKVQTPRDPRARLQAPRFPITVGIRRLASITRARALTRIITGRPAPLDQPERVPM